MTDVCKSLRAVTSNITRRQKTKGNKLMYEKGEKKKKRTTIVKKKKSMIKFHSNSSHFHKIYHQI